MAILLALALTAPMLMGAMPGDGVPIAPMALAGAFNVTNTDIGYT